MFSLFYATLLGLSLAAVLRALFSLSQALLQGGSTAGYGTEAWLGQAEAMGTNGSACREAATPVGWCTTWGRP